jgi:hypothetical protein
MQIVERAQTFLQDSGQFLGGVIREARRSKSHALSLPSIGSSQTRWLHRDQTATFRSRNDHDRRDVGTRTVIGLADDSLRIFDSGDR